MGDTKLLPCPCCGSAAKFMQDHGRDCSKTWIECFGCGLQSAHDHWMRDDSEIRAKLAAAWNRRPALLARQEGEDKT